MEPITTTLMALGLKVLGIGSFSAFFDGWDGQGNPDDRNGWGQRPLDGHGNDAGRDVWGNSNNRRWWD
jgi:hypothetical protein